MATAAAVGILLSCGVVSPAAASTSSVRAVTSTADFPIEDNAGENDRFGSTVVKGNFNGDAYEDLAVSVPYEDVGGIADAGAVNVIYGSFGGLSATPVADQFWHQDASEVEDAAEAGDRFGTRVAAGDFNGDSYDDIAVGAPFEDVNGVSDAGAVNVIYGSPNGLSATHKADQLWHQDVGEVEDLAETDDQFGWQVEAGNFNGDNYDDLAISLYNEDVGPVLYAGAMNVIHGSLDGLSATQVADQFWHQDVSNVEDVVEPGDRFGVRVAVGNFNGDSYDDIAVGVLNEDVGTVADAGAVNVIYGSLGGLSATQVADQFWHQDVSNVEDAAESTDQFGSRVAVGNFNDGGYDDLAIGAPHEDLDNITDAGVVHVIYGSLGGLSATHVPDQLWHQNVSNVEDAVEVGDWFGWQIAVGNFNAGPYDDIAISAHQEDLGSVANAGAVHVIYGSLGGLTATGPQAADQFWHQDVSDVEDTPGLEDLFGWGLAAGRFNAGGYEDIAIGVPGEEVGSVTDAGAVNVIHGSYYGLNASGLEVDQLWHQDR
jgi:hypothetical protein